MSPLADALALIRQEDAAFADLLTELYDARYTGTVLLHTVNGIPRVVEFPSRQVRLAVSALDIPRDLPHSP